MADKSPDQELKELQESDKIAYSVIAGSNAYGTNNAQSDIDLRGIFIEPMKSFFSFTPMKPQIANKKKDIVYYSLFNFLELVRNANPNLIELLWMPQENVQIRKPFLEPLFANRDKFITRQAYITHARYAKAQIGKAKGQNKWVNNPKPEAPPSREDFVYIISFDKNQSNSRLYREGIDWQSGHGSIDSLLKMGMPFRPVPLSSFSEEEKTKILRHGKIAGLEHLTNTFRLYDYSETGWKGWLFVNDALVLSSIPIEDEWKYFKGLLIYNGADFEAAKMDHKNYWTWRNERNEARWVSQEKGETDFDAKNMSHCMRLMLSAESILKEGFPVVRFSGEKLQLLKDIREGRVEYKDIMARVDALSAELESLYLKSTLPEEVDVCLINKLLVDITEAADRSEEDPFCGPQARYE